jgi:hypothetical protein
MSTIGEEGSFDDKKPNRSRCEKFESGNLGNDQYTHAMAHLESEMQIGLYRMHRTSDAKFASTLQGQYVAIEGISESAIKQR